MMDAFDVIEGGCVVAALSRRTYPAGVDNHHNYTLKLGHNYTLIRTTLFGGNFMRLIARSPASSCKPLSNSVLFFSQ